MKNDECKMTRGGAWFRGGRMSVPCVRAVVSAIAAFIFTFHFSTSSLMGEGIPWKLPTYTLVARSMDLRTALDTFAVAQGMSVIMSQSVGGVFSGDFVDVAPDEFLNKIATTHNLIWYYDGAALYLYGAGEIATVLLDLQYMKAGEVMKMLSELGVEDSRYPFKATSGDELIMVSGPPRYVALVSEMIAKADKLREKRSFNEIEARLFPLTYTWADDVSFSASSPESVGAIKGVASILNELMGGNDAGVREGMSKEAIALADAAQTAGVKPIITAENLLNAVLVRDVSSRMPIYEKLIAELDVPQKLVQVDVTVVELSRNDALDWQLALGASGTQGSKTTYAAGQAPENLFDTESLVGQGLAGAVTHIRSKMTLNASLTALRQKGKARSISRTSLLTVNNIAAEMTDSQSYHAKVIGSEVATLQEVSAGTRLSLKPRILPSISTNIPNQIWMSLELDDGGFEAITVESMPMKRTSTLLTQTAIFEDESIMLAGYLREIDEDAGWGIPFLRDIPLIGWLFGGKSTRKETVQRLFLLTPHIIDLDAEMVARLQATHFRNIDIGREILKDVEEEEDVEGQKSNVEEVVESRMSNVEEADEADEVEKVEKVEDAQETAAVVETPAVAIPETETPAEEARPVALLVEIPSAEAAPTVPAIPEVPETPVTVAVGQTAAVPVVPAFPQMPEPPAPDLEGVEQVQ